MGEELKAVAAAAEFVAALNEKFADKKVRFSVMHGHQFDRIVIEHLAQSLSIHSLSVHAFVEKETSKLFKAHGWTGPVKNPSYDLSTPEGFTRAVENADLHGGYLYHR